MKLKTSALVFFAFLGFLGFASDSGFSEISLEDLKQLVQAKSVTLLDNNGTGTYKEGHIPTAISFRAAKGNLAAVLPKDKGAQIVAYCGGPLCSAWEEAAEAAKKLGYTNIKHFKGGITGWNKAKLAVEKQPN